MVAAEPVPAEPQNAGPNAVTVPADWSLIPKDSNSKAIFGPGESFRLLFITSTTRNAEPTDIGTYNSFVQARANAISALQPFKGEFRVVGSTGDVDARDNTATTYTNTNKGVPIYWVGGDKVADHYGDFYDNSWDSYAGKTESGAAVSTNIEVWTGSSSNGTKTPRTRLGGAGASFQRAFFGALQAGRVFNDLSTAHRINLSKPFYALSPVITVAKPPGPPEPQTVLLGSSPLIPRDSNGKILFKVGESFRLLFVTEQHKDASSTDINDYNSFVQGTKIGVLDDIKGELRALVSTAAVDARDNTATTYTNTNKGVPIYWISGLDNSGDKVTYGAKVADDYKDFYDGTWGNVDGTQEQVTLSSQPSAGIIKTYRQQVWTGSNSDGTKHAKPLGTSPNARCGYVSDSSKKPIDNGDCEGRLAYAFYALSPVLTVDSEPVSPALYTVTPGNRVAAVHWTIPRWDDTLARWQYRYKADSGEYISWRNMSGSSSNSWNYTVRGLTNGTAYTIQIRAVDKRGVFGQPSEEQTVTPYALTAPTARTVPADWGLIPEGIKPGQSFRLMFITYDRTNAESKHIDTYNSFVQAQAAAATADYPGGVSKAELRPVNISGEFRALMSTATVDARVNTATTGRGVPIYWVGGEKVADNYADFYDGSWDMPSYGYHQSGHLDEYGLVWTGSNANGTKHKYGFASGFYTRVARGSIPQPGSRIGGGTMDREQLNALYAISPVLTVAR